MQGSQGRRGALDTNSRRISAETHFGVDHLESAIKYGASYPHEKPFRSKLQINWRSTKVVGSYHDLIDHYRQDDLKNVLGKETLEEISGMLRDWVGG